MRNDDLKDDNSDSENSTNGFGENERINISVDHSNEDGSNESSSDESNDGPIECDFDFCDPKEDDYSMVKSLLAQGTTAVIPGIFDSVMLIANDVCEQAACGTTITVNSDVYSFISALSGQHYGDKTYMTKLVKMIKSSCPEESKKKLEVALQKGFAWLFCERLMNVPNELIPPLYEAIISDIEWSRDNINETGGTADMFEFEYLAFVAPCYFSAERIKLEEESDEDVFNSDDEEGKTSPENTISTRSKRKPDKQEMGNIHKIQRQEPVTDISKASLSDAACLYFEQQSILDRSLLAFPIELVKTRVFEGKAKGAVPQRHKPKHAIFGLVSIDNLKKAVKKMKAIVANAASNSITN